GLVRDQERRMAKLLQARDGQQYLILAAPPGPRGVDVDRPYSRRPRPRGPLFALSRRGPMIAVCQSPDFRWSSHSFANFRNTYCAFMTEMMKPGLPSRNPRFST